MSETHKAILEKANAAIAKGDIEGFLKFCTEDTEWNFLGDQTIKGKEAVRQWMKATYLEPPTFTVHRMLGDGEFVAALGDIVVKDDKGKPARHEYCDVWRFRDGKMAELRAFVIATDGKS
jgi:uncharacterized protein